ncbi:hypothetical protein HMPREF9320_0855 [Streptococcus pseudoporcinus SPIN 20026]|nr:hypothetical protein HMPREF9320_0855 [Streptococcus pseudoporcinus SPIN 20026]
MVSTNALQNSNPDIIAYILPSLTCVAIRNTFLCPCPY